MLRKIGGIIIGVLAALLGAALIALIGDFFFPMQVDPRIEDPVARMSDALPRAPVQVQLFIALSWFAGGLCGALAGKAVSGSSRIGWIAAAIMAVVAVLNIFVLPLPTWLQIGAVILPLLGGLIGVHLVPERATAAPAPAQADA